MRREMKLHKKEKEASIWNYEAVVLGTQSDSFKLRKLGETNKTIKCLYVKSRKVE